ncbi:glycosyltransferase family 9 protein [Limisalsivibrio acetivorans]|uniref:glycosyltransferase family 9 protein n=1 Tax=Limisalsivibrio acetivorans TaxID=1304888 RepID=UPI0003B38B51|nr:glycosyltransferase family 9 protein [Limisalsivibrio acetivorans]
MKVLFVRFGSLGDVILTTGVIRLFKQHHPTAEVHVFTSKEFAPVYNGLDFINHVVTLDRSKGMAEFGRTLQQKINGYDRVIDLHSNLRSKAMRFMTEAEFVSYKKDSAERRRFVKTGRRTKRLDLHVTQKYAEALNRQFGLEYDDIEELRPVVHSKESAVPGRVVIHPYASRNTKVWDKFPELAGELVKQGRRVAVVGSGDFPSIEGVTDLSGTTGITELFDILASAQHVITTDSGPMHAAVALKVHTVAIFGSTTREFGFYPCFEGVDVIENNDAECRPCHVHGLDNCPKEHFKCMKEIDIERVLQAIR